MAAASDWWIKHADARGAGSTTCRILGVIAARALDSAKTGQLWSLPAVLKVGGRRVGADIPHLHPCLQKGAVVTRQLSNRTSSTKTNQPAHQPFYLQLKGKAFDPTDPQHREQARRLGAAGSSLLGQVHLRVLPALDAEADLVAQAPRMRELDPDMRAEASFER